MFPFEFYMWEQQLLCGEKMPAAGERQQAVTVEACTY